jgi:hypothetical protein
LMQVLLDELIAKYSKPLHKQDLEYVYQNQLDQLGGGIQFIRYLAGKQKRHPIAYAELESKALYRFRRFIKPLLEREQDASVEITLLIEWMTHALYSLPRIKLVPYVLPGFTVESLFS